MSKQLSGNSEGLFKHLDDDSNTCLSSTKNWSKQPVAYKNYHKGVPVCPENDLPIDLNTHFNGGLPVPLSKLEQKTEITKEQIEAMDKLSEGREFATVKKTHKHFKQTIHQTEYRTPYNKLLEQKGIDPWEWEPFDGMVYPILPKEEQDYIENGQEILRNI